MKSLSRRRKDVLPTLMKHIPLSFFLHALRESKSAHRVNGSYNAAPLHDMCGSLLDQLLDKLLDAMLGRQK